MGNQASWRLTMEEIRSLRPNWPEQLVQDYFARQGDTDLFQEHIDNVENPHEVLHDQLTDVSPDQHHNQVHDLYGSDHGDVDLSKALSQDLGLFYDESLGKFLLDSRTKVFFQETKPNWNRGDLWVVRT